MRILNRRTFLVLASSVSIAMGLSLPIYVMYMFSILAIKNTRIHNSLFILLGLLLFDTFIKLVRFEDAFLALTNVRYYYGFIFFLLVLSCDKKLKERRVEIILFFICVAIIVEYFIINNQLLPQEYWVFIPQEDGALIHPQAFGSMRPYGISQNPTMTSTIICVLYVYIFTTRKFLISSFQKIILTFFFFIAIIVLRSGMGFLLFSLSLTYLLARRRWLMGFVVVLPLFVFAMTTIERYLGGFQRFSFEYIVFLFHFKWEQAVSGSWIQSYHLSDFLLGVANFDVFVTDIGWLPFFLANGMLGVTIYLCAILFFARKPILMPLALLLIGAIHYPAIFGVPGQLLLAFLLAQSMSKSTLQRQQGASKNTKLIDDRDSIPMVSDCLDSQQGN